MATLVRAGLFPEAQARARVQGRIQAVRAKAEELGQGARNAPEFAPAVVQATQAMRAWLLAEFAPRT